MHATRFALAFAGALVAAAPVAAQETWSGNYTVGAGKLVEIKGINGSIRAVATSGNEVRVVARKTARRSSTADVRIEAVTHPNGVTLCAIYPTPARRQPNECRPGEGGRMNVDNNDVQVEWEVHVPRDVDLVARTVNGGITGESLPGNVIAKTVNGGIKVAAAGTVQAVTVNGSISADLGRTDWNNDLDFETVNGGITITFRGDINAVLHATTVNGDIDSDFPVQVTGRFGPKRVSGTIGTGGRQLHLRTVNGGITLRKR